MAKVLDMKRDEQGGKPMPVLRTPGRSGLEYWGRSITDEWHPRLQGKRAVKTYREMTDNDPVIGSFIETIEAWIKQAPRQIKPVDDSIEAAAAADFITGCLDDMSVTFEDVISEIITMVSFGYSLMGVHYKVRRGPYSEFSRFRSKHSDGLYGFRKISPRDQETIEGWEFDSDGGVRGAYQQAPPDWKEELLPLSNHLLFRTKSKKNNPEGRSFLRNAYRPWFFLKRIQEFEAIGVERDLAGLPVFELPVEYFAEGATAAQKDTVENYTTMGERIRTGENSCLVFPAETTEDGPTGWKARLMQSGGRRPMDTDPIIKRLESRIAISFLGEGVLLGMQGVQGSGASWSLHSGKTHMLGLVIHGLMKPIESVFNRYAFPRLMALNNWDTRLTPNLVFGDIETDESPDFTNSLATLVNSGIIVPDHNLEKLVRTRMGLDGDGDLSQGQVEDALGAMEERQEQQTPEANQLEAEVAAEQAVPIEAEKDSSSQFVSSNDAAEILNVSHNSIKSAIRRGQLPGNKVGNQYRIARDDLMHYMRGEQNA